VRRCARELNRHLCVPITFSGDNILKCSRRSYNIEQIGPDRRDRRWVAWFVERHWAMRREALCKGPW
jgi:hypothetical protein